METLSFVKLLRDGNVLFYRHVGEFWPAKVCATQLKNGSVQKNLYVYVNNDCYLVKQGLIRPEKCQYVDAIEIVKAEQRPHVLMTRTLIEFLPFDLLCMIQDYDDPDIRERDLVHIRSLESPGRWEEWIVTCVLEDRKRYFVWPRANDQNPKQVDKSQLRAWSPIRVPDLFHLRETFKQQDLFYKRRLPCQ